MDDTEGVYTAFIKLLNFVIMGEIFNTCGSMNTEIGAITSESLAQTEAVLGDTTWITRLHDQESGLRTVSNMRQFVYPKVLTFLSLDRLYGFETQHNILQACIKTVGEGSLIWKSIHNELHAYEKDNFQYFFSNLKNGTKRDPCFTPKDAWNYLTFYIFYISSGKNPPSGIQHASLSPADCQYNNLAFQFEAQRLFLNMYEKWVNNNTSLILQQAHEYSQVVQASVMQTLNGQPLTVQTPVSSTTIAERVTAQRNNTF